MRREFCLIIQRARQAYFATPLGQTHVGEGTPKGGRVPLKGWLLKFHPEIKQMKLLLVPQFPPSNAAQA